MKRRTFRPKPGQTDFSRTRWTPVINCVVMHRRKILLVKRSNKLNLYPGYWNSISGFLDDHKGLDEKVAEELREEAGIAQRAIARIRLGPIFDQEAPRYKKTWIVHPVLVEVRADKVRLNWEAAEYRWATLAEAKKMRLLPGFKEVLGRLLPLLPAAGRMVR